MLVCHNDQLLQTWVGSLRSSECPGPAPVIDKNRHNKDRGFADVRFMGKILIVQLKVQCYIYSLTYSLVCLTTGS